MGKFFGTILTFILVSFAFIIFRANTVTDFFTIARGLGEGLAEVTTRQGMYALATSLGLGISELIILALAILTLMITELCCKGAHPVDVMDKKPYVPNLLFYVFIGAFVMLTGVFYETGAFIYFQF